MRYILGKMRTPEEEASMLLSDAAHHSPATGAATQQGNITRAVM